MQFVFKLTSYISSLFLVAIVFWFKFKEEYLFLSTIPYIIVVGSIFYVLFYIKSYTKHRKHNNMENIEIIELKQEKFDSSNYLLTNVLPIISLDITDEVNLCICISLILIIGFIYIKNDLFYINPLFEFFSLYTYSSVVYIGKATEKSETFLISEKKLYNFKNTNVTGTVKDNIIFIE